MRLGTSADLFIGIGCDIDSHTTPPYSGSETVLKKEPYTYKDILAPTLSF
jgi:hypothetical protein